jgi:hypothetical protein
MSYILDVCDLESKTCKWQSIGTQGPPGPPGSGGGDANFVLENVGCNRDDPSQKNVVIAPSSTLSVPQNIVIRTYGINDVYGNFIRDDLLTDPKGDKRGSGAIDLSVKRELCSQVASGDFFFIILRKYLSILGTFDESNEILSSIHIYIDDKWEE